MQGKFIGMAHFPQKGNSKALRYKKTKQSNIKRHYKNQTNGVLERVKVNKTEDKKAKIE